MKQFFLVVSLLGFSAHIYLDASFVHAQETRRLISSNKRKIENQYPQLVNDVFKETIRFGLNYQKDQIWNIIFTSQNNSSAMLEEIGCFGKEHYVCGPKAFVVETQRLLALGTTCRGVVGMRCPRCQ